MKHEIKTNKVTSLDNNLDMSSGDTNGIVVVGVSGDIHFLMIDAITTPATGFISFSAKEDGEFYSKNSAGVETQLSPGGRFYLKSEVDTFLANLIPLTQKGAANGVATLGSDSKIPAAQLPALAITDTFVIASQAAMLALSAAEKGDVAVRTDLNKSFILTTNGYATLSNWQELLTPTDSVISVNGATGAISLSTSDIGEGTRLYFTNARGIASTLTGFTSGAGTIASSDTVLQAVQKLDGNIATKQASGNYLVALTGDVTASGPGSVISTIAANVVTNSRLAQIGSGYFKARLTAATGNVEDLTGAQATSLLSAFGGDSGSGGTKGLVPAPGVGDAVKFLQGNGTWALAGGNGTLALNDGSYSSPSLYFTSDTTQGLYKHATNQLGYSGEKLVINGQAGAFYPKLQFVNGTSGTAAADGISLIYDTDSNLFSINNQEGGSLALQISGSNVFKITNGYYSQTIDLFGFTDNTSYIGRYGAGNTHPFAGVYSKFLGLGFGTGTPPTEVAGTIKVKTGTDLTLDADHIGFIGQVFLPNGSAAAPGTAFASTATSGFFKTTVPYGNSASGVSINGAYGFDLWSSGAVHGLFRKASDGNDAFLGASVFDDSYRPTWFMRGSLVPNNPQWSLGLTVIPAAPDNNHPTPWYSGFIDRILLGYSSTENGMTLPTTAGTIIAAASATLSILQADDTAADNNPAKSLLIKGQNKTAGTGLAAHGGDVIIQGGDDTTGNSANAGGQVILRFNGGFAGSVPQDLTLGYLGLTSLPGNLTFKSQAKNSIYSGTERSMSFFSAAQGGNTSYQNISDATNGFTGNSLLLGAQLPAYMAPFYAGYFGTGGLFMGISNGGNVNQYDASAILQAVSTTKGFLPPVMTTTQKSAISSPASGLVVFDSTLAKLCVYTGSAWETVTSA
jgi:hypothetical protein